MFSCRLAGCTFTSESMTGRTVHEGAHIRRGEATRNVADGTLSPSYGSSEIHQQFEKAQTATGAIKKVKRIGIPARIAPKTHAPNSDAPSAQKLILEAMESSQNAVRNLQNAAALIQFSVYLENVGPEKALQMLAGLSQIS